MQKDFSVIIVSYNNYKVSADCLDSIDQMNDIGDRLEVVVVEQSTADDVYNKLKENYPNIVLLRAENKGFGAGNNRGAEIAQGKYLLFLNPDTILIEPIFKFAIDKFEQDLNLGLFGVQLLNAERKKTSSRNSKIPYGFMARLRKLVTNNTDYFNKNTMYIEGADLFVRKELFFNIGAFDENLFMYCEETDLCNRILCAGYRTAYYSEKKIVHLHGGCSINNYEIVYSAQLNSFEYLCKKYGYDFTAILKNELYIQKIKHTFGFNKQIAGIASINIEKRLKHMEDVKL